MPCSQNIGVQFFICFWVLGGVFSLHIYALDYSLCMVIQYWINSFRREIGNLIKIRSSIRSSFFIFFFLVATRGSEETPFEVTSR